MLLAIFLAVTLRLFLWSGHRLIALVQGGINIRIVSSPNKLYMKEVILAILLVLGKFVLNILCTTRGLAKPLTLSAPFMLSKDDIAQHQNVAGL